MSNKKIKISATAGLLMIYVAALANSRPVSWEMDSGIESGPRDLKWSATAFEFYKVKVTFYS